MRIQHNIMAMNAYRNYTGNTKAVAKNLEKLSSGYKINRAGDDAAGLAISEKMRARITGLKTAQKNAKDGISLVQTAEGALTEVHDMLNRMVELADQSANGTYDNEVDRANLQKEFDALRTEIDRIADSSNFNGKKLLDGSLGGAVIKENPVGADHPTTSQGSVDVVLGDPTTPAKLTFSLTPEQLQDGGSIEVAGHKFVLSERYAPAAASTTTHYVGIAGLSGDEAKMNALAKAMNSVFSASGDATQIGGKTFSVAVTDGKLVMTAESAGALNDGTKDLTLEDIQGMVKVEKPAAGHTPPSGLFTIGNTTLGHPAASGQTEKAVITVASGGAGLVSGAVITIGDTEYTLTSGGTTNLASGIIAFDGAGTTGAMSTNLAEIAKAVSGTYSGAVTYDSGSGDFTLTLTAVSANTDIPDFGGIKISGGTTLTPVIETQGKAAQTQLTGSMDVKFDISKIKDDAKVIIDGETYVFDFDDNAATGAGITVVDLSELSGSAGGLTTSGEMNSAMTALANAINGNSGSGTVAATVAVSGNDVTLTLTETVSGGNYKDAGAWDAVIADVPAAPAPASMNDPATPMVAAAGPAVAKAGDTVGNDAKGSTTITFSSQPKANSTISVGSGTGAVTFEFVKASGDAVKTSGAIAVVIGSDVKSTTKALADAMTAQATALGTAGATMTYDATKDEIVLTNNSTDLNDNDAAPKVTSLGGGMTLQIGEDSKDYNQLTLSIADMHAKALGIDSLVVNIDTQEAAQDAVEALKTAINSVSSTRGGLGATQNRLEHTINNLSVMQENIQDAESSIRDTDVADEMMAYTKNNILVQSAQAMLAQANQVPQGVLQLLQ